MITVPNLFSIAISIYLECHVWVCICCCCCCCCYCCWDASDASANSSRLFYSGPVRKIASRAALPRTHARGARKLGEKLDQREKLPPLQRQGRYYVSGPRGALVLSFFGHCARRLACFSFRRLWVWVMGRARGLMDRRGCCMGMLRGRGAVLYGLLWGCDVMIGVGEECKCLCSWLLVTEKRSWVRLL